VSTKNSDSKLPDGHRPRCQSLYSARHKPGACDLNLDFRRNLDKSRVRKSEPCSLSKTCFYLYMAIATPQTSFE
jgi:hypothetical protein